MYGTPLRFSISSAVRYNSALSGVVRSGDTVSVMVRITVRVLQESGRPHQRIPKRRPRALRWRFSFKGKLDDQKRRSIRMQARQQWHRHVVDGYAGRGLSFGRAAMGVPMKDRIDAIPVDWLFEAAGT